MTTQEGNNAVVARHLEALANAAKDYTLAKLANISVGDATYDDFTGATSSTGGLSGLVPAPAAGDQTKFLRGDGAWATVSSGSSGGGTGILDTVPATVDGGIWYELFNGKPVLKMHKGDYNYVFENSRIQRVTASEYLVAWLRFNQSPTRDECGIHTWTAVGSPVIDSGNLFSENAFQVTADSYVKCADEWFPLGGRDFTIDCWCYNNFDNNRYAEIFCLQASESSTVPRISLGISQDAVHFGASTNTTWTHYDWADWKKLTDSTIRDADDADDFRRKRLHCAYVYRNAERLVDIYLNGLRIMRIPHSISNQNLYGWVAIGKGHSSNTKFTGAISEFRIHDGIALWTENFTPPTAADYA